jgi:hypothetical protein
LYRKQINEVFIERVIDNNLQNPKLLLHWEIPNMRVTNLRSLPWGSREQPDRTIDKFIGAFCVRNEPM